MMIEGGENGKFCKYWWQWNNTRITSAGAKGVYIEEITKGNSGIWNLSR